MNTITIIEGADLDTLCRVLGVPEAKRPHTLRIWQHSHGDVVKVKVNEGMWTPGLGKRDGA